MKTAVSIPDDLFRRAEKLARRAGKSRSWLFREALREYVARHDPDEITEAIDRLMGELAGESDEFVSAAPRHVLERTEW